MHNLLLKSTLLLALVLSTKAFLSQSDCNGNDSTPPVLNVATSIGDGFCGYPQPEAAASDDSGEMVVITSQLQISTPSDACELIQPDLGSNLCLYVYESCMMLFSVPFVYSYYALDNGEWIPNSDGTAQISATVHSISYPNGGFIIQANFINGMTWDEWSSIPYRFFKADCEGVGANHPDWMYYVMSDATLVGTGDFEGSFFNLTHSPVNQAYGYQVGLGANNYSPEFGSGGWFNADGILINNGDTIPTANIHGDFMFKHECDDSQPELQYVYTASDPCENSTVAVQSINTCDIHGPLLANMPLAGTVFTPCQLDEWQPEWLSYNCDEPVDYTLSYAMGNLEDSNDHLVTVSIDAMACSIARSYQFSVIVPSDSELPCHESPCIADVNGDHWVTSQDVMEVIGNFLTEDEATDLNQDGVVNVLDLIVVIASYGTMCD